MAAGIVYWTAFAVAAVAVFFGPAICSYLQDRADRLDRELWEATFGSAARAPYDYALDGNDDWGVAA